MKKIGIIAAMDEEMNEIKKKMKNIKEENIYELKFIEGKINEIECVLVKCGIGKVNAARTTQIMIDNHKIDCIINVGSAGGLDEKLNIGDIVIGDVLVQHDFDLTAFGHEKGYISELGREIRADKELVEKCKKVADTILENEIENNCMIGAIASGDAFCTDIKLKEDIINEFNAICVEMEGAAIAQVCILDKIPFVIIRSISDKLNGNNQIEFEKYLITASKNCANFIDNLTKIY